MKKLAILLNVFFFGLIGSVNAQEPTPTQQLQYGSFYTKKHLTVAPEHAITFDNDNVCPTKGVTNVEGTGDILLKDPGVYRVSYSVSLKEEKCQSSWSYKKEDSRRVALSLNGSVIPGSEMFIGENEHFGTLSLLVKVCGKNCCDYTLRVINNSSLAEGWSNLHLKSGQGHQDVSASITIEKVTDYCNCCR